MSSDAQKHMLLAFKKLVNFFGEISSSEFERYFDGFNPENMDLVFNYFDDIIEFCPTIQQNLDGFKLFRSKNEQKELNDRVLKAVLIAKFFGFIKEERIVLHQPEVILPFFHCYRIFSRSPISLFVPATIFPLTQNSPNSNGPKFIPSARVSNFIQ